jgi:hypothetical protein
LGFNITTLPGSIPMNDANRIQLETLILELHGRVTNTRKEEQLSEALIPPYLLDEYNRAGAGDELFQKYPTELSALGAIAYAAIIDPAVSVRLRCAKMIAETDWAGGQYILVCCTYDRDPEVRLLSLESIAVKRLACTMDVARRLAADSDDLVSDLALRLLRGDVSWPVYKY